MFSTPLGGQVSNPTEKQQSMLSESPARVASHPMARPVRIQYKNACYHVMNRGRGRRVIFHGPSYYRAFLQLLEQASSQFDAVIHAYCLMGNHYHLSIQTPEANLDRIMRHINGVYTQRYNIFQRTDGPLFRGRYKAILIHESEYFLQLSRYIHRNPVESKRPLISNLADYPWSSYPAYIGKVAPPKWLHQEKTRLMLEQEDTLAGYREFVEDTEFDDEKKLFSEDYGSVILGNRDFRMALIREKLATDTEKQKVTLASLPGPEDIIFAVAEEFSVSCEYITERVKVRCVQNLPRQVAIYCCFRFGKLSREDIGVVFDISSVEHVTDVISRIRQQVDDGELRESMFRIERKIMLG